MQGARNVIVKPWQSANWLHEMAAEKADARSALNRLRFHNDDLSGWIKECHLLFYEWVSTAELEGIQHGGRRSTGPFTHQSF